ncbi:MAG: PH domain-containing protein [Brockia lithotrophica]|nr:PH domain-containing protein [Brockia lithotrophica]
MQDIIWQDRARLFGVPVLFTSYRISGETLFRKRGIFFVTEDRLPLYRVLDVQVKKTPLDLIFRTGTVVLYAADVSDPSMELKGIRNPNEVADLIMKLAESLRDKHGIRGKELVGALMPNPHLLDIVTQIRCGIMKLAQAGAPWFRRGP